MTLTAFLSYIFITAYTPGPNNIMAMANAGNYGFKKAMPFNLGILTGFFIDMSVCAAFSAVLFNLIPRIKPFMLYIGAVYILWLAYSIWRDKPKSDKKGLSQTNTFTSGMVLQFINIKVILYGITAMSSFVLPNYPNPISVFMFILLLTVVGFSATICWALFGAAFDRFFKSHSKLLNTIMALALIYCAVSMVL